SVRCPSNDCGPRVRSRDVTYESGRIESTHLFTDSFRAYADGSSGFGFNGELLEEGMATTYSGASLRQLVVDTYFNSFRQQGKKARPRIRRTIPRIKDIAAGATQPSRTEEHGLTVYTAQNDQRGGSYLNPCA